MVPIRIVDAFASGPFSGNPAAVCRLKEPAGAEWMQAVASEMNLSETAFLVPEADGFRLRWFTPGGEVDLCGHATLASAHVLWEEGHLAAGAEARFHTRSGVLTARRDGDWIELDFPAEPPQEIEAPALLRDGLRGAGTWFGQNRLDYFVLLPSEETLRNLEPDMQALRSLGMRGVIVTAQAEGEQGSYDFVSRFFAPAHGIPEDPVTGSAHCALAPFWRDRLGREALTGFQASRRGGVVGVEVRGERVALRGQAVTVLRGELLPDEVPVTPVAELLPLADYSELDAAVEGGDFILFKHSTACGTSARAFRQVNKFLALTPSEPVYMVDVISQRELSRQIEERFGVRHESPQVILVRGGVAKWNASHFRLTAKALAREAGR
ncbi:MAG: bacillithiol system redox-active protein YtxJ [Gemmatimonadota bacterium]